MVTLCNRVRIMPSSRTAHFLSRHPRNRRRRHTLARRIRRWRKPARQVIRQLNAAPLAVRVPVMIAAAFMVFFATNVVYHVMRKPTEMFFPLGGALNKEPSETWQQYRPLFREYSTTAVTPELLAALAQVEGAGNPVARTYWQWRLTWRPFAIYEPASSAVGMYQMTDAAFAEARRYCIRHHTVVEDGCGFNDLYSRIVPSDSIELTAVYLNRNVAAILADRHSMAATPQQKQDLAAIIQLCGAGPAGAFADRHFHLAAGERCGDHDPATYLAEVDAMKRQFARIAADRYGP
jgi:Transglycosylase SLT domain